MNHPLLKRISTLAFLAVTNIISIYSQDDARLQRIAADKLKEWKNPLLQWQHIAKPKLDSIKIDKDQERITLFYAPSLSYYPFREESSRQFTQSLKESLGRRFKKFNIEVFTNNFPLNQLVPNYFRQEIPVDSTRFPVTEPDRKILVRKAERDLSRKGAYRKIRCTLA